MNDPEQSKALVTTEIRVPATLDPAAGSANPFGRAIVVPHVVAHAGDRAARRFANFFGSIENDNNRAGYQRACALFFDRPSSRSATCITGQEAIDSAAVLRDRLALRFRTLGDGSLLGTTGFF
jgi:hypothetical protein